MAPKRPPAPPLRALNKPDLSAADGGDDAQLEEVPAYDYDGAAKKVMEILEVDSSNVSVTAGDNLVAFCSDLANQPGVTAKTLNKLLATNGLKNKFESKKAKVERLVRGTAGDDSMPV